MNDLEFRHPFRRVQFQVTYAGAALDNLASAFRTCAIQYGNGNAKEQLRYMRMQLEDTEKDHCFAKCLWTTSGQYDAENNIIDVSKVISSLPSVPEHLIELGLPTDGSCKAVFDKTRTFIQREFESYQ